MPSELSSSNLGPAETKRARACRLRPLGVGAEEETSLILLDSNEVWMALEVVLDNLVIWRCKKAERW